MENWEEEAEETDLYPRPKVPGKKHGTYVILRYRLLTHPVPLASLRYWFLAHPVP